VLAATSRDIQDMVAKGQFREDLYYRLNVIRIELPPLRERLDDVPLLVKRFMDRVNAQNGSHVVGIQPDVIDALQGYHWPGNVRELLNVVERMIVLTDKDTLDVNDLPAYIRKAGRPTVAGTTAERNGSIATNETTAEAGNRSAGPEERETVGATGSMDGTDGRLAAQSASLEQFLANTTLEELENLAIGAALRRFHNHRTRAARALGISVRTLQRKLGGTQQMVVPGEVAVDTAEAVHDVGEHLASSEKHG
jgi:two-component system NtrC family response regulator